MTYQQWLADAAQALNQVNPTENGKVDALVLLQHATGKSRTQILAFDETEIDEKVRLKLTALLDRRLKGEPIAYILGEKEFWSLPLNVSEGTLIPRPDTDVYKRQRYGWFRYKSRFKLIKHFFMFISKAVCIYRRFLFT